MTAATLEFGESSESFVQSQRGLQPTSDSDLSVLALPAAKFRQEILGRTKFCCVEKSPLIPGFAFSLFAGKFTKPDLHKLPDKLTNEISISTVEFFVGFFKLLHRGDAPILIIELSGCADDFLALCACCQFVDNFAQKMFVIAFGRFKLARQVD